MYTNPPNPPPNNFDIFKFRQVSGGNYCKLTLSGVWCLNMFLQPVVFWGYGGFPRLRFVIFSQCFKPGVALASFAGKCQGVVHRSMPRGTVFGVKMMDMTDMMATLKMLMVRKCRWKRCDLCWWEERNPKANHRTWDGAKALQIVGIITIATSTGAICFKDSWGLKKSHTYTHVI